MPVIITKCSEYIYLAHPRNTHCNATTTSWSSVGLTGTWKAPRIRIELRGRGRDIHSSLFIPCPNPSHVPGRALIDLSYSCECEWIHLNRSLWSLHAINLYRNTGTTHPPSIKPVLHNNNKNWGRQPKRRGRNPLVLVLLCSLFESRKFGSVLLVGCETVTGWNSWTGTVQSTEPVNRLWLRVSSYAQIHCSLFAAYSSSSAIQLVYGMESFPLHCSSAILAVLPPNPSLSSLCLPSTV